MLNVGNDRYDSSASLVRLLCLAVEKLGGSLSVPEGFETGDTPSYALRWQTTLKHGRLLIVHRTNVEVGDVLDVSTLSLAPARDVVEDGQVVARVWTAGSNGVTASLRTEDLNAVYYQSPIMTMRTMGVALVDASGQMAVHTVVNR
jgi:hypothetical protein